MVVPTARAAAVTSLFVRGGESNYTKVLLDGIPLNEPGGTFNFGNVTTENLERIEIVRGAQSALFGSDAMAGVIQLFTRAGAHRRASARRSMASKAGRSARRRVRPARPGTAGRVRLLGRRGAMSRPTTRARTTSSTTRRCREPRVDAERDRDAALRRPRRARHGGHARPDGVRPARSRRVLRAPRRCRRRDLRPRRHAGSRAARHLRALDHRSRPSTNLMLDPPYTPSFEGQHGAVRVLRLRLRQPQRAAPALRELPGGLAAADSDAQPPART